MITNLVSKYICQILHLHILTISTDNAYSEIVNLNNIEQHHTSSKYAYKFSITISLKNDYSFLLH